MVLSYLAFLLDVLLVNSVHSKECTNLLPGMIETVSGVDRTSYDIQTEPSYPFLSQVVNLTCDSGLAYYDEFSGITYDWPDQFSKITAITGSITDIKSFLTQTMNELKSELVNEQTPSIGIMSNSQTVNKTSKLFAYGNMAVGIAKSNIDVNELFLVEVQKLNISSSLMKYINQYLTPTPAFNNQSVDLYNELFKQFGTDYLESSAFGGELCLWFYVQKSLYNSESIDNITNDASNYLYNIIVDAGGAPGPYKPVSDKCTEASTVDLYWRGGSPSGSVVGVNFTSWSKFVPSNPAFIGSSRKPIYNLFGFDPLLQINTQYALTNYADLSFIRDELQSTLDNFLVLLGNIQPRGECNVSSVAKCDSYPSYPSCANYYCSLSINNTNTCPDNSTYCGIKTECCQIPLLDAWTESVNQVMSAVNNLTDQILQLQMRAKDFLSQPIVNHDDVVDVWNQYSLITKAIESNPKTDYCSYVYTPSNNQCAKWSNVSPSECLGESTQSVATSCPYSQSSGKLASLWYPEGILFYL